MSKNKRKPKGDKNKVPRNIPPFNQYEGYKIFLYFMKSKFHIINVLK